MPRATQEALLGNVRTGRILFLGNSITLHAPLTAIGWPNNWGMAASAKEKDYVHILARSISALTRTTPVLKIVNIVAFERTNDAYDLRPLLKEAIEFKADTVIVSIGENVTAPASKESKTTFRERLKKLLTALKEVGHPTIIVRSSFWADKTKDEILKQACADAGGVFVDISGLCKEEANYARSERAYTHGGVAAHPGDKGMQAIADALLTALKNKTMAGG